MKRLVVLVLLILCGTPVFADPLIFVYPSVAPNGAGSPSFGAYTTNAIAALISGASTSGDPSLPSYYYQQSDVSGADVLVTSFASWHGQADPGTVFGPAFANELGNRLHFGLKILGNGSQFSISQLSFVMDSTDPWDGLDWNWAAGSYNYGSRYVGVLYGGDGVLGGGDDTLITSGPNTQLIDALFGVGSGNAYWPCYPGDPRPCSGIAERQAVLNEDAAYNYPDPYFFTGTYYLVGTTSTGSGTFTIHPTPEPATLLLLAVGLCVLAPLARPRRR